MSDQQLTEALSDFEFFDENYKQVMSMYYVNSGYGHTPTLARWYSVDFTIDMSGRLDTMPFQK